MSTPLPVPTHSASFRGITTDGGPEAAAPLVPVARPRKGLAREIEHTTAKGKTTRREAPQRRGHVDRIVLRVRQPPDVDVGAVADHHRGV